MPNTLSLFISFGYSDLNELNGIKVLYVSVTNGTAAVLFIIKDIIIWDKCLLMLLGSILGGFYGAKYSLRLRPCILKNSYHNYWDSYNNLFYNLLKY